MRKAPVSEILFKSVFVLPLWTIFSTFLSSFAKKQQKVKIVNNNVFVLTLCWNQHWKQIRQKVSQYLNVEYYCRSEKRSKNVRNSSVRIVVKILVGMKNKLSRLSTRWYIWFHLDYSWVGHSNWNQESVTGTDGDTDSGSKQDARPTIEVNKESAKRWDTLWRFFLWLEAGRLSYNKRNARWDTRWRFSCLEIDDLECWEDWSWVWTLN